MKKLMILLMMLLLVGCSVKDEFDGEIKEYISNDRMDLSEVNPEETTYEELVEMFGIADNYYYGEKTFDVDNLPKAFYMYYDAGVSFRIKNNRIVEMILEKDTATFNPDLYVGQFIDEALLYLGEPEEIISDTHLYYKEGVLYKNLKEYGDGHAGYYYDATLDVRVWLYDDIITNITYLGFEDWELLLAKERYNEPIGSGKVPKNYSYFGDSAEGFEDDPELKGKWIYIDQVFDLDEFDINCRRSAIKFVDLNILDRGDIEKSNLEMSNLVWTKGGIFSMYHPHYKFYYDFKIIDGNPYLVLEEYGMYPRYYIFEREVK